MWDCGRMRGHLKLLPDTHPHAGGGQSRSTLQFLYLPPDGTSALQTRHRCLEVEEESIRLKLLPEKEGVDRRGKASTPHLDLCFL